METQMTNETIARKCAKYLDLDPDYYALDIAKFINEATEQLQREHKLASENYELAIKQIGELQRERDELQDKLSKAESRRNETANCAAELLETSCEITKERDSLKRENERLREAIKTSREFVFNLCECLDQPWNPACKCDRCKCLNELTSALNPPVEGGNNG